MVFGPQFSHPVHRIQPIDADPHGEDQKRKKQQVRYQGRDWVEEDKELPIHPHIPEVSLKKKRSSVFADHALLERAQALFEKLNSVEEKAAQLFFLQTDAIYHGDLQKEVELLIQAWQIGGILFHKGEFRRQAYLIQSYQEISKIPLLFANDFSHGLSFYFQGDSLPANSISQSHYTDLGKAVMGQNHILGVQIQFDRERGKESSFLSDEQSKGFHLGIRNAQGIVGKEKSAFSRNSTKSHPAVPIWQEGGAIKLQNGYRDYEIKETINFKTLTFFDITSTHSENLEQALLTSFNQVDLFLCSDNITEAIRTLAALVDSQKLSESELDRHVMKSLITKSYFFK